MKISKHARLLTIDVPYWLRCKRLTLVNDSQRYFTSRFGFRFGIQEIQYGAVQKEDGQDLHVLP